MATSLVSKINTSVALVKGWVNSFLAFMGQLYFGFYRRHWMVDVLSDVVGVTGIHDIGNLDFLIVHDQRDGCHHR